MISERDLGVQRFLSILLPVKDAQATLHRSVQKILEMVSDAGGQFEVVIIDDGSADATCEVAQELACHYPQVHFVRHGTPLGRDAAIETGLKSSRGDVVVVRDDQRGFCMVEQYLQSSHPAASRPTQPNYLRRVKSFALGE
jgi:glycosyltransferase involved in cell wall biosynthesis